MKTIRQYVSVAAVAIVAATFYMNISAERAMTQTNPTAKVVVVNGVNRPVPVYAAPKERVTIVLTSTANDGETEFQSFQDYAVPANKRLVVEHLSVKVTVPTGQAAPLCGLGGDLLPVTFLARITSQSSDNDFYGAQLPFAKHLDTPTNVHFLGSRNSSTGTAIIQGWVYGYLVDIP